MFRTKDNASDLVELTGETGAALLNDVVSAVDDLAANGVIAKEDETATAVTQQDAPPTSGVDLEAMRQTIDRLKQQQAPPPPETPAKDEGTDVLLAQVTALREDITSLRAEVASLRTEQQLIANKEATAAAAWAAKLALLDDHNAKADAVIEGLFDLVLGVSSGAKEIVVEREGQGSPHDPAGVALANQVAAMARTGNGAVKPGDYAGAQLFGERK